MLATTDFVGLGALIGSICAGVVSIIVALRQTGARQGIEAIHDAVRMSNGQTLGDLAEINQARNEAQDAADVAVPVPVKPAATRPTGVGN